MVHNIVYKLIFNWVIFFVVYVAFIKKAILMGKERIIREMNDKMEKENVMSAYIESPQKGLETELEGKKLYEWGKIFLDLAKKGLKERNEVNANGNNETVYLNHVENVVQNKKNRAQLLLEQYNKTKNLDFFKNEKENFNYSGF